MGETAGRESHEEVATWLKVLKRRIDRILCMTTFSRIVNSLISPLRRCYLICPDQQAARLYSEKEKEVANNRTAQENNRQTKDHKLLK